MREKRTVTIREGSRELVFTIRPMSAWKLEKWMYRAAIQIAKANGMELAGESIEDAQNAMKGLQAGDEGGIKWLANTIGGLDFEKAEPLIDELLSCAKFVPDTTNPGVEMDLTTQTIEGNIDSPVTLMKLRMECLKANFGFFATAATQAAEEPEPKITFRKTTKTSRR